jgi:undecaprenyl-diphosphatase
MGYFEAILLGLIQGLTEILPISSSGHLVLSEHLLDVKLPGVLFELMVHFGTLMSILIYFRKRIFGLIQSVFASGMRDERRMVYLIIIGTIPAVIAGILFKDFFERAFSSPVMTSIMLLVTGLILLSTSFVRSGSRNVNVIRAIVIGIGQALAIMPGISRSGSTISAGLLAGVKPLAAAEYSFILAIPAIFGAIVFKFDEIVSINTDLLGQYLAATAVAFLSGLLAVYVILDFIRKGKFKYFGFYCLIIGVFGLIYFS